MQFNVQLAGAHPMETFDPGWPYFQFAHSRT